MEQTISDAELAIFNEFLRGTNIDYAEIALSFLEVRALNTTEQEIVAAPGTGYTLEFISALLILDYATAAYANNGVLGIYETDAAGQVQSDTVDLASFLAQVADTMIVLQALSADTTMLANKALVIASDGDSITGEGLVRVKVAYRIHSTGLAT